MTGIDIDIRLPTDEGSLLLYVHNDALADIKEAWEKIRELGITQDDLLITQDALEGEALGYEKRDKKRKVLRKNDVMIWIFENGVDYVNAKLKSFLGSEQPDIRPFGYEGLDEASTITLKMRKQAIVDIGRAAQKMKEIGFTVNGGEMSKSKIVLWIFAHGRQAFNEHKAFVKYGLSIRSSIYK